MNMGPRHLLKYLLLIVTIACFTSGAALAQEHHDDAHSSDADAEGEAHHGVQKIGDINWFSFKVWSEGGNPPFVAVLFNFSLLCVAVYFIMRKGMRARFKDRREVLEESILEARAMKAKAEEAMNEARKKIDALDDEMTKIREDNRTRSELESKRIVDESQKRAQRMNKEAKVMLEQEMARVTKTISDEIAKEVINVATQLLEQKATPADQDRLATEYLDGITNMPNEKA